MNNQTHFAAGRFERKPDLVTRSGGVPLSPMTNNKARVLRDAVESVKANTPKTREDWLCFNGGIDSIFAEYMEIFVDPEKFASSAKLKDPYDEARRKFANELIKQPSSFRKSLVSKFSELRSLKSKEQAERMCEALFLDKQDEMLQLLEPTAKNARIAAARRKAELDAKSRGGKKGAAARNAETSKYKTIKETLKREVRARMRDYDKRYPERHQPGYKGEHTNNSIFQWAEKRPCNLKANGEPIFKWETIKDWFKPSKMRRRGNK